MAFDHIISGMELLSFFFFFWSCYLTDRVNAVRAQWMQDWLCTVAQNRTSVSCSLS